MVYDIGMLHTIAVYIYLKIMRKFYVQLEYCSTISHSLNTVIPWFEDHSNILKTKVGLKGALNTDISSLTDIKI